MREIKECTAEVFRRSEKRIKDRKRNRILVLCIPLCIAVTAVSVWSFPAMRKHDETYDSAWNADPAGNLGEAFDSNAFESTAFPYTAVELQTADPLPGHTEQVTDQAVVTELFERMQTLFADADGDGMGWVFEGAENFDQVDTDVSSNAVSEGKAYTIAFTTQEGMRIVYHLNGNTLLNGETEESVFLTDVQLAELLAVFGIAKE